MSGDVVGGIELSASDVRPVGDEEPLQVGYGVALDTEVFIAPLAHAVSIEVVFCNIYATQKCCFSVCDDYFPMVAVGTARREPREPQRFECVHFNTGRPHFVEQRTAHSPRTDGIVDDAYFHAGARLADEDIGDGAADAVVAEDIVFHMDRAGGPLQCGDQRREGIVAVVEQPHFVVVRHAGSASRVNDSFESVGRIRIRGVFRCFP